MNIQTMQQTVKTMTSREIATLCDKAHGHVKRDIEVMLEQIGLDVSRFGYIYFDSINRQQTEYLLDKNLTITLVAGYNAKVRYLIVQRWQELEQSLQPIAPVLPDFNNPVASARAWADEMEAKQAAQAQLAIAQTKVAALDVISGSIGSMNARDTAKTLGVQPTKFNAWCIAHNWMYRDARAKLQMCSNRLQQNFMEQRAVTYRGSNGEPRSTMQPLFTPRGLTHLASIFAIVHEVA